MLLRTLYQRAIKQAQYKHIFSQCLALIGIVACSLLLASQQAYACGAQSGAAGGGHLFLQKEGGDCIISPQLDMDVSISVTGTIARVKVEQHFRNPGSDWVEGVYVFPLPEDSAVDHMRLRIGERVIEGEIKEKRQAKAVYRAAKKAGKKASLLSQQRPNMFTTSVANIGPKEMVTVTIEYQQAVRLDQGLFSLRFPMTITQRFIPGVPQTDDQSKTLNTTVVPDADEITPPFAVHGRNEHPIELNVDLMPGFPVASVHSLYHSVEKNPLNDQHVQIALGRNQHSSNADFVLEWSPLPQEESFASVFTQQIDSQHYALLMVMPPDPKNQEANNTVQPRDVVFVIDTSGSMAGESIKQAKEALVQAIDQLGANDRFNIIEFNSQTHTLFSHVQPANREIKAHALSFVRGLYADKGTQMYPAIDRALIVGVKDGALEAKRRVRQIIFMTDGAVGNEDQLFNLIKQKLGNSRFFTVGIGSAPNSHFMSKAAEFGRGTFTYIGRASEVKTKMNALFQKLQSPVLTDINIDTQSSQQPEFYPQPVPDLYKGEPLMVAMKMSDMPEQLTVTGRRDGEDDWRTVLSFDQKINREGVSTLWARRKIDNLTNQYIAIREPVSKDEKRLEITQLAIDHHLVSRFTSLIAVDKTPTRPEQEKLKSHALKNNVPKGSKLGLSRGATSAELQLYIGLLCILLAALMYGLYGRKNLQHHA